MENEGHFLLFMPSLRNPRKKMGKFCAKSKFMKVQFFTQGIEGFWSFIWWWYPGESEGGIWESKERT